MAFVYLLGDSGKDNTFKIGVTRGDLRRRIKKLQTGNSEEIYLVDFYKTEYPFYIERFMHTKYAGDRQKGEWFEMDTEDVTKFRETCREMEKIVESLKDNPFAKSQLR